MPALRHRLAHFVFKKAGFFERSYREQAHGRTFTIPIINGRKTYVSEPWLAFVIKKLLQNTEGVFVDVGVNLGQTLLKVAAAEPERAYLGFEPNSACADYATKLSQANGLNATVVPAGLGGCTTVALLQLYSRDDTDSSASIVADFRSTKVNATQPVVILAWDDLPPDLVPDDIAIVKIDVEGGEAEVIEGIEHLLEKNRPYILLEVLPAYSRDNSARLERQRRIEQVFGRVDYSILRIMKSKDGSFSHLEELDDFGLYDDLALSDYLIAPRENKKRVQDIFAPAP